MKKSPLDFCSISDRSVSSGGTLLPWVSITALASLGAVKPTLGSKVPPLETLLPDMEKKSSGFFISDDGKRHSFLVTWYLVILSHIGEFNQWWHHRFTFFLSDILTLFFPMQFLHYSNCFFALIFKAKSKRFLLNYLAVATFFSTLKCTRRDLGHRE